MHINELISFEQWLSTARKKTPPRETTTTKTSYTQLYNIKGLSEHTKENIQATRCKLAFETRFHNQNVHHSFKR